MATCIECSYYKPCEERDDVYVDLVQGKLFRYKEVKRTKHVNAGDDGICWAEPHKCGQYRDRPACHLFVKKAEA